MSEEVQVATKGCTISLFGCCLTILALAGTVAVAVKLFRWIISL